MNTSNLPDIEIISGGDTGKFAVLARDNAHVQDYSLAKNGNSS